MSTHTRIGKVRPFRLKGERARDYIVRTKYLQVHADLTAWKASQVLDGGHTEAKLRGETR
ncbi:hypothetical protein OF122_13190 [Pelagibacterium flavum]|uniref:Integrase n=1 Tax=Pelagibacterium flavum TaxID=2984530 RepID=A0ABY6IK94_9HYPH|nr:hypothetical protein [Pelagibacterium sp. YIM 151497]UYQ71014.1 hypothetical protein OF122_13190 [Pelagibacterium sp. YIM 151497]